MRPTEVFYHFYIPEDTRSTMWTWWIDEQLRLLQTSGLSDAAKVKMCITMPMAWGTLMEKPFMKNLQPNVQVSFSEKVQEYIHDRYPFVQIISVRDISMPNIFEGVTLHEVYKAANQRDIDVLYIHNKGTVSNSASVGCWRQILNHFSIVEWEKRKEELNIHDVVGVRDLMGGDEVMSGNFWWSKSEYIKRLPAPLDTSYIADPIYHMYQAAYRYAFEKWIMVASPNIHYAYDTKTNHYNDYSFLEDIIKGNI